MEGFRRRRRWRRERHDRPQVSGGFGQPTHRLKGPTIQEWGRENVLANLDDVAKGGKSPGKDYLCVPAPGTKGAYTFNIDSFVMFEQKRAGAQAGQKALAEAIMSPEFQEIFNLNKGSIPAHAGVSLAKFDQCAKDSTAEFQESSKNNTLVPSWAHGMAIPDSTKGALFDVVTQFFNDPSMSAKAATQKLAQAAKTR